jgi:hypothetical protein
LSHPQSFFCIFLSKRIINRNGVYFILFLYFFAAAAEGNLFISSLSISFQQPGSFHLSRRTRLLERTQVDTARAFVATRADLSPSLSFFSANQPSSAGYIWGTNNKIKKRETE